jgi:hypothetical protein
MHPSSALVSGSKRSSQRAKNPNLNLPDISKFANGKIPFAKSPRSSQFPNGDDIKLPEIMTDSENEFEQPSWANSPNLREALSNQQLIDPKRIFGTIAALEMDKVFPNHPEEFCERSSSADWSLDGITAEVKTEDRKARKRLKRHKIF